MLPVLPRDERMLAAATPERGTLLTPEEAFSLALQEAWRGLGYVSPNPLVGAVLVDREHRFLAAAAHERFGEAHAEVNLLKQVEEQSLESQLQGATLYVTLEPCSFAGKTPACTDALKYLPLKKVVFGCQDPHRKVRGQGIEVLKQAGIDCELFVSMQHEAEELIEAFACAQTKERPFVGLKAATSLDGAIAREGDKRIWITGGRARDYGHFLRLRYDAIAVGRETVVADNPSLTYRHSQLPGRNPYRVIFDAELKAFDESVPRQLKILGDDPDKVIWLIDESLNRSTRLQPLLGMGVKLISLPRQNGVFHPGEVLSALMERGIGSLLLEGGSGLYGEFLSANLVDRLHLIQAPVLYGNTGAIHWLANTSMRDPLSLSHVQQFQLGQDRLTEARL